MYGTVAKLRIRSGREADLVAHLKQYRTGLAGGFVASALYRADDGDGHWLAVVFESKEAYEANANSPEQDTRYREMRELLESDPEWHDGEVLLRVTE
jgi:Antibiotic biosynthesis monooxygenase